MNLKLDEFVFCSVVYSKNIDLAINKKTHEFEKKKISPYSNEIFFTKLPKDLFSEILNGNDFIENYNQGKRIYKSGNVEYNFKDFQDYGNYCLSMPGRYKPLTWQGEYDEQKYEILVLYWNLNGFSNIEEIKKNTHRISKTKITLNGILKLENLLETKKQIIHKYLDVSSIFLE